MWELCLRILVYASIDNTLFPCNMMWWDVILSTINYTIAGDRQDSVIHVGITQCCRRCYPGAGKGFSHGAQAHTSPTPQHAGHPQEPCLWRH